MNYYQQVFWITTMNWCTIKMAKFKCKRAHSFGSFSFSCMRAAQHSPFSFFSMSTLKWWWIHWLIFVTESKWSSHFFLTFNECLVAMIRRRKARTTCNLLCFAVLCSLFSCIVNKTYDSQLFSWIFCVIICARELSSRRDHWWKFNAAFDSGAFDFIRNYYTLKIVFCAIAKCEIAMRSAILFIISKNNKIAEM